jgi:3-oxoacyl-[acyl-carrier protein] reductase
MGRLEGRAILVTGATSGIRRAIARRCATEGANVLATGRNEARLAELAQEFPSIAVHPADLAEPGAADGCAAMAAGRFGRLDGLVHAAGIVRRGEDIRSTTDEQWSLMRDINLDATFRLARACLREMVTRRSGSVVLVGRRVQVR